MQTLCLWVVLVYVYWVWLGVLFSWLSFLDLLSTFGSLHVGCVIGHLLFVLYIGLVLGVSWLLCGLCWFLVACV